MPWRHRREVKVLSHCPNLGVRNRCVVNATSGPLYARKGPQYPLQEAGRAPGSIWMGFGEDKFPFLHRKSNPDYPTSGYTDQAIPAPCSSQISVPKRTKKLGSNSEHFAYRIWETNDVKRLLLCTKLGQVK